MSHPIKVHGLTDAEVTALRELALRRYGKASISLLAKKLLQEQLGAEANSAVPEPKKHKNRMELRLPAKAADYLDKAAVTRGMTPNMTALSIIMEHIYEHPFLSDKEVTALYQSNYQLLSIGRNINQLARQFNRGEGGTLTSQQIKDLSEFIGKHTEQVRRLISTNRRRAATRYAA